MVIFKDISAKDLKDVIELAWKYDQIDLPNPVDLWTVIQKCKILFPYIFQLIELCLFASYSNAAVERFFQLHEDY